jgi:hypothetical protein
MEKRAQKEEEEEEAKKDAEGRTYAVPLAKTLSKVTGTPQGNTSSESSAYAVVGRGQTVVSFHKKNDRRKRDSAESTNAVRVP